MLVLEIAFWLCVALLVHTHLVYPLTLWLLARGRGRGPGRGARLLRRQRVLGAAGPARARCALRRPGGGLRMRSGALQRPRRGQPGGRLLALRACGARPRVTPR